MRVESIQIGSPKPSPSGRLPTTGIDKQPVATAQVTVDGLVGDTVVDQVDHGGADQAVYIYLRDDYSKWEAELGRPLPGGTFGENLTIRGGSSADVRVGDRFVIGGSVTLEATGARISCAVFAHRMGESNWTRRFRDARMPGVYCRVITPGTVRRGADLELISAHDTISVLDTQDLFYDSRATPERLELALCSPIAVRARQLYEKRLARATRSAKDSWTQIGSHDIDGVEMIEFWQEH